MSLSQIKTGQKGPNYMNYKSARWRDLEATVMDTT